MRKYINRDIVKAGGLLQYYLIKGDNIVGKIDRGKAYLYDKRRHVWQEDINNFLRSRVSEYQGKVGNQPSDGDTPIPALAQKITEEQANEIINSQQ
ncbi:hypothetical protein V6C21_04825 [[Clostridium] cellulosi]